MGKLSGTGPRGLKKRGGGGQEVLRGGEGPRGAKGGGGGGKRG